MIVGRLVRRGALMRRIFMSYRQSDTADQAGRIYDRLVREFPRAGVFKDVDSVPAGAASAWSSSRRSRNRML